MSRKNATNSSPTNQKKDWLGTSWTTTVKIIIKK